MWPRPAASRRSGIRACSGGCDALQKGPQARSGQRRRRRGASRSRTHPAMTFKAGFKCFDVNDGNSGFESDSVFRHPEVRLLGR
jgi:hypothetical protein